MATTGNRPIGAGRAEQPQRMAQQEKDAVGIAAAADDERLTAPRESLLEFFRNSPLAEAMAKGELDLERERDPTRNIVW
jgi:hypothetical protein